MPRTFADNYNKAFIEGSKSLRASAFKDHEATDMHKRAMVCSRRVVDIAKYGPIAKALSTLDPVTGACVHTITTTALHTYV